MTSPDDRPVTADDTRLRTKDVVNAVLAAVTIIAVTVVVVAALVEPPPPPAPVTEITTDDLEAMRQLLEAEEARPRQSPGRTSVVRRLTEVVEAIDGGEIVIVPSPTTAPVPPPATTPPATAPPPTTAPPRPPATAPEWPGIIDAPIPTITLPTLPVP